MKHFFPGCTDKNHSSLCIIFYNNSIISYFGGKGIMQILKFKINLIFSQSMFLKLTLSFILIIFLCSSFYLFSYNIFIKNIEEEIINNTSERLDNVANKINTTFQEVKDIMLKITIEDFFISVREGKEISPYVQMLIIDTFKNYKKLIDYKKLCMNILFILPETSNNNIITSESTLNAKSFFDLFYSNEIYTRDFWHAELKENFSFKFYPLSTFMDKSHYVSKHDVEYPLMPIAFKEKNNSNFIIVTLINLEELFYAIDQNFVSNIFILDQNHNMLYSSFDSEYNANDVAFLGLNNEKHKIYNYFSSSGNSLNYVKTNYGYVFYRYSKDSNLTYGKLLPNTKLREQLSKTNLIFNIITIVSLLTSFFISLLIVKKFNDPVRQIMDILKNTQGTAGQNNYAVNFHTLKDSIQEIVTENSDYKKDLDTNNSFLEVFQYMSVIKNIYPSIRKQLDVKRNYILVYYKIHFKSAFFNDMTLNQSTTTYLTEVIQSGIKTIYNDSVTFQLENDQVISVINLPKELNKVKEISKIKEVLNDIEQKLSYEKKYIFLTIVVSNIYQDVSQLNQAYNKALEIYEHRAPTDSTQILYDDTDTEFSKANCFYLPSQQEEQLINLLNNGKLDEIIELISGIFDYNYRKKVDCFYIKALCHEIVNCCIKVLTQSYYEIPKELDTEQTFQHIKNVSTIDESKSIIINFASQVIKYINNNKKKDDYIISTITSYIQEHYDNDIYVELLANKLNLTSNYVSAYFKDKVGINLSEYINKIRINKSIDLLETTSFKVKDISQKVGFSNVNTFIRVFKKHIGATPVEYKKKLLQTNAVNDNFY